MRICILTYSFYELDTRVLQYVKACLERGDEADVVALRQTGQSAFEVVDGANVYRIQERKINEQGPWSYLQRTVRFLFHASYFIARIHWQRAYDIVHVHSVPDFLVFAAIPLRLSGIPVILDIHDILPELYASKFKLSEKSLLFRGLIAVEKLSASFASHVIIANDLWKERLLERSALKNKCSAFCNYPDADKFSPRPRTRTDDKFVLLYPGSLNWLQGLDVAIRAFSRVALQIENVEFQIYGDGPAKPELVSLTKSLDLESKVIFHPLASLDKIAEVMSNSNLAIVPKRASSPFANEAASTKIMEFMAMGVPVVVSRTKIDSFYHDSSRVEFFESENVDELAVTIVKLYRDVNRRTELIQNAFRYVLENSWALKKLEYLALVDALTGQSVPPESTAVARRLVGGVSKN